MKQVVLFFLLTVTLIICLVSCDDASVSTLASSTSTNNITESVTTTLSTTAIQVEEGFPIALYFTDAKVCSSEYDTKSAQEGTLVSWDRWYSTDFVKITDYYGFYFELASHKYLISLSFFDENKTYISGVGTTSTSDASVINGFVSKPANAVYARAITFTGISTHNATYSAAMTGYRNQEDFEFAAKKFPNREFVIACIGDSLTEGDIGGYTPGVPDKTFQNYPYYLGKIFGCRVVNYGKCGYTAQMMLDYYRQGNVDITEADVILVMLGTNAGLGVAQYNAYVSLLDLIKADMKEDAKLILITPPHASRKNNPAYYQYVVNAASSVFKIGQEKSIDVIDAHKNSPIQGNTEALYQPNDGLHMVERGYEVFASYIAEELIEYLAK